VSICRTATSTPRSRGSERRRRRTADLADVAHVEALVADVVGRHGRLDVLVSAAGTLAPAPFLELTPE
jgi:NAD(P)-dependent dehydrogenase (short-subunit alcohol dehydrogenase family)